MNLKMYFAAFAAAALTACSMGTIDEPVVEEKNVDLEITVFDGTTKADGAGAADGAEKNEDEFKVKSLQVFVYGAGGVLEKTASSSSKTVNVNVTAGTKTFRAIVNADEITGDPLTQASSLEDNALDGFIMEGSAVKDITTSKDVHIEVKRHAAKVTLESVTNNLTEAYKDLTFNVVRAYLINVPDKYGYFSTNYLPAIDGWLNQKGYTNDVPEFTLATVGETLETSESTSAEHVMYCYPNPTEGDSSAATWSARHTRLVVEVQLGNGLYYYPITLDKKIEPNAQYNVTLSVTKPGSASADQPYAESAAEVTIEVADWEDPESYDEVI